MAARDHKLKLLMAGACAAAAAWWLWPEPPEAPAPAAPVAEAPRAPQRTKDREAAPRPLHRPWLSEAAPTPAALVEEEDPTPSQTADPRTRIVVHVIERDGQPVQRAQVVSTDCDLFLPARRGTATVYLQPDQVCSIKGGRRDGLLVAWSEPEIVEGGEPDDELYLEVPAEKTAGLGISIGEHEYGILVRHVFPGSPAARAGIRAGDVIVELEGRDTIEMPVDEFIAEATGPVDTEVEIVVARIRGEDDWEEFSAIIVRQAITRPRG